MRRYIGIGVICTAAALTVGCGEEPPDVPPSTGPKEGMARPRPGDAKEMVPKNQKGMSVPKGAMAPVAD